MSQKVREYRFTIEVTDDEQANLQKFLFEAYKLSISCFSPVALKHISCKETCGCPLISLVQPLIQKST